MHKLIVAVERKEQAKAGRAALEGKAGEQPGAARLRRARTALDGVAEKAAESRKRRRRA